MSHNIFKQCGGLDIDSMVRCNKYDYDTFCNNFFLTAMFGFHFDKAVLFSKKNKRNDYRNEKYSGWREKTNFFDEGR